MNFSETLKHVAGNLKPSWAPDYEYWGPCEQELSCYQSEMESQWGGRDRQESIDALRYLYNKWNLPLTLKRQIESVFEKEGVTL